MTFYYNFAQQYNFIQEDQHNNTPNIECCYYYTFQMQYMDYDVPCKITLEQQPYFYYQFQMQYGNYQNFKTNPVFYYQYQQQYSLYCIQQENSNDLSNNDINLIQTTKNQNFQDTQDVFRFVEQYSSPISTHSPYMSTTKKIEQSPKHPYGFKIAKQRLFESLIPEPPVQPSQPPTFYQKNKPIAKQEHKIDQSRYLQKKQQEILGNHQQNKVVQGCVTKNFEYYQNEINKSLEQFSQIEKEICQQDPQILTKRRVSAMKPGISQIVSSHSKRQK